MSRSYVTFDDIAGRLDALEIECGRCPRKGRYRVDKLIEKYGRMGNLSQWLSDLPGACPKRNAFLLQDRCDVRCPDLAKVL